MAAHNHFGELILRLACYLPCSDAHTTRLLMPNLKKESHTSVTTFGGRHVKKKKNTHSASTEIYLSELKLTVVTGGT